MAAYEPRDESIYSVAASGQSPIPPGPSPASYVSQPLISAGGNPLVDAVRLPTSDSCRSQEWIINERASSETISVTNGRASTVSRSNSNAVLDSGSLLPISNLRYVHDSMEALPNGDLETRNGGWIQPQVPSFSDEADIGSILFEQLESGQSWMDIQLTGQQPGWMDQWVEELHLDIT